MFQKSFKNLVDDTFNVSFPVDFWAKKAPNKQTQYFNRSFINKNHRLPSRVAALAYNGAMLALESYRKSQFSEKNTRRLPKDF